MASSMSRVLAAGVAAVSLFVSATALAEVVEPKANPTEADISQARQDMAEGVALMTDPDGARYAEAYTQFREAYRLSGSLNAAQNLGICAMQLELDGEAVQYFKMVLDKHTDLSDADREQLEKDITRLQATLAWVTLEAAESANVMNERIPRTGSAVRNVYRIEGAPLKIGVRPGSHTFTATNDSGATSSWQVEIGSNSTHSHVFSFDEAAPGPGPTPDPEGPGGDAAEGDSGIPVPVWIAGGTTVAAGITFGVLAGVASSKASSYESDVFEQSSLEEQQSAYDEVNTFNLVSDVMLGVTLAAAATTVVLYFVLPDDDGDGDETPRLGRDYIISPTAGNEGGGLQLTARF